MRRRKIRNTAVELTELGFGASVIGNLYRTTTAEDAAAALDTAWD
ncbi:aldo/keto reductase, partial [Streptomyces sp. NPDC007901]